MGLGDTLRLMAAKDPDWEDTRSIDNFLWHIGAKIA